MRRRSEVATAGAASPRGSVPTRCVNAAWVGNKVKLLERLDDGGVAVHEVRAEYSGFVPVAQLPLVEKHLRRSPRIRGYRREGSWVRVLFSSWADRRDFCKPGAGGRSLAETLGFDFHEADLNPVRRFLADHPEIEIQKPLRCYLDIEADSRVPFSRKTDARILCWAVVGEEGEEHTGLIEADTDDEERGLLEALVNVLAQYDQVCAWHGGDMREDSDGYDFPMILARSERRGLRVDWRRWLWLDDLAWFRKSNVTASESGDEKASFSLDSVARAVLGEGEGKLEGVDGSMAWDLWCRDPDLLVEYCLRDTTRLRLIEQKKGYLAVFDQLANACGCFADNVGAKPVQHVEAFALRVAAANDVRLRSNWRNEGGSKFEGAYVQKPTMTGLLRNVHVFDFSGMYPSIMQTWNLSPETHRPDLAPAGSAGRPSYLAHVEGSAAVAVRPPGVCVAPGTGEAFAVEPRGVLVLVVDEIRRLRKFYDDLKASLTPGTPEWKEADCRTTLYKQLVNGVFGVTGCFWSRLYVRALAESITTTGGFLIKRTMSEGESWSIVSIYGDTDSGFALGVDEDRFRAYVEWCNKELYPRIANDCGCARNELKLAYEKEFEVLILVGKKRYAGRYRHYKGKRANASSKPEIKGLEFKRGDTARLCRRFQERVIIDLLATPEHPEFLERDHYVNLVLEERERVLNGELERGDFVLSKRLSKDPASYARKKKIDGEDAAEHAHVAVAKRMAELGMEAGEGTRIEYVVTDASDGIVAVPVCEYQPGTEDRHYLWEKLVYPATQRVLEVVFGDHDWDQYRRTRPPKPKRGRPVPEEQTAFDFGAASGGHANTQQHAERREDEGRGDREGRDASRAEGRGAERRPAEDGGSAGKAQDAQSVAGGGVYGGADYRYCDHGPGGHEVSGHCADCERERAKVPAKEERRIRRRSTVAPF